MPRPAPSPWSPWVLILGIGICTEPVEALKGSLDACSETEVPWSQVQQELLVLQNLVPGSVSEERLHALRELALTGGLDPQECDCWYGWISLRFFIPQVLEPQERLQVLEHQLFHTELIAWLASPWIEMLDSLWKPLEALAATSKIFQRSSLDKAGCSENAIRFWQALQNPSLPTAQLAAAVLLDLPEDLLASDERAWDEPCPAFAAATAAALLGVEPKEFRVTPGYALYLAQQILKRSSDFGLLELVSSAWPVATTLARLAVHLREGRDRSGVLSEDDLAQEVIAASMKEFPELHPSFLPPMARLEKLKLFAGVSMAHAALTAAQVPYFAITGTLLGAVRHHGFVPWDGDADLCVDINDELRLLFLALLQGDGVQSFVGANLGTPYFSAIRRAQQVLNAAGFELWANAERPLTFKLAMRDSPRVPGKMYGYPYMDIWFCHHWAEGDFSLQSANFGVGLPRQVVFPRRKLFFEGLTLRSFGNAQEAIVNYYKESNALEKCVGHGTFHRQERQYSEDTEHHRFNGKTDCANLAQLFSFASPVKSGAPPGLTVRIMGVVKSFLQLQEPRWTLDPDPVEGEKFYQAFREARAQNLFPLSNDLGPLVPRDVFEAIATSELRLPGGQVMHHLIQATTVLESPTGSCELLLRLQSIHQDSSSSLGYAASRSALTLGEQLVEAMGRVHPWIDDWDDDGTPKKPTTTEPLSYSLAEKFAIVVVLETITIGSLLVFVRRSKFLQRKDLTPRQVNATLFGAFLLAPVFILIQKAYYDTLIEFRGLKPEQHSIGSYLNLSLLSPTKWTIGWGEHGSHENGGFSRFNLATVLSNLHLLNSNIVHADCVTGTRFHWDYEQHTNPDAKVNPTLHDSWKWHDDE